MTAKKGELNDGEINLYKHIEKYLTKYRVAKELGIASGNYDKLATSKQVSWDKLRKLVELLREQGKSNNEIVDMLLSTHYIREDILS